MRSAIVLCLAGLILGSAAGDESQRKDPEPKKSGNPQEQLQALKADLSAKTKELAAQFKDAKDEDERQKLLQQFYRILADSLSPLAKLAKDHADDAAGKEAAKLLQRNVAQVSRSDSPQVMKALRGLMEQAPKDLQGQVGLALSENLRAQYERAYQKKDKMADKLLGEARTTLQRVAANHPDLDDRVKDAIFALDNLTVGRKAMDIEGEDIDGKKFKLSDYRGKVVVIDFWGHW